MSQNKARSDDMYSREELTLMCPICYTVNIDMFVLLNFLTW